MLTMCLTYDSQYSDLLKFLKDSEVNASAVPISHPQNEESEGSRE